MLSLLHEQANNINGEAKFKELCLFLIQTASVPYMQILEKWVYKGVICDPYEEVRTSIFISYSFIYFILTKSINFV